MTAVAAGDEPRNNGTGGGVCTTPPPPEQQQQQPPPPPPEQGLRCPRCDSPNTKFCYYNNYSLSQPRHFCKTCRRYWTKGGALRNVPVGGGCRKNKRSRSTVAAATSSRLSLNLPLDGCVGGVSRAVDQQSSSSRLGFLGGGAPVVSSPVGGTPAADYQGAAAGMMAPPRLHVPAVGQYVPFVGWPSGPAPAVDLTGGGGGNGSAGHATNVAHAGAVSSSIASSIESLSFINQDLHWKLQQQRLSTMFLALPTSAAAVHVDGPAPPAHVGGAFFQMAAGAPAMEDVPAVTSWITDSSYVLPSPSANTAAATATNCNINRGRSSGDDDDHTTYNINCSSGIPAWGDMSTFAMLP